MLLDKVLSNLNVSVEPFAICLVSEGWRLNLPGPPDALVHFVLEGKGRVLGPGGESHAVGPGSLAIIPRGAEHALETEGPVEHIEESAAPCSGFLLPELIAGGANDPPLVVACGLVRMRWGDHGLFDHLLKVLNLDLSSTPAVGIALRGILEEQSGDGARPGSAALTAALMSQCLVHVLRCLAEDDASPMPWLHALSDPRLGRAVETILDDPAAEHTVESLADTASMSRSAFAERFAATIGATPMGLVNQMRMGRAEQLLQQDESRSVDEIAERVGYASRSHVSRAFKKHNGLSPAEFRAKKRGSSG
jgi:AraC-like DNA-binding protein